MGRGQKRSIQTFRFLHAVANILSEVMVSVCVCVCVRARAVCVCVCIYKGICMAYVYGQVCVWASQCLLHLCARVVCVYVCLCGCGGGVTESKE